MKGKGNTRGYDVFTLLMIDPEIIDMRLGSDFTVLLKKDKSITVFGIFF